MPLTAFLAPRPWRLERAHVCDACVQGGCSLAFTLNDLGGAVTGDSYQSHPDLIYYLQSYVLTMMCRPQCIPTLQHEGMLLDSGHHGQRRTATMLEERKPVNAPLQLHR